MIKINNFNTKLADLFIKSQENLSSTRFIQDTATNWAPKAVFARSREDFFEMSFLEFLESGIFYFASPVLGEKLFRNKIFKNLAPKNIRNQINELIPKSTAEILKNKNISNEIKKRAIATKAGIVLACTAIPVAEYVLSFAKNLFTLKTFNKSNFNNIANLDKNEKEDKKQQEYVEQNSKKHLKRGALVSIGAFAAGLLLALCGNKSNKLQTLSKTILEPGKTISNLGKNLGIKSKKTDNILSRFSLDFANENGKLALSKGQLALTAIVGLFGYSKAAEDRGKLDVQEVWTRVPLVVFYTIFGSELFEKGFIKICSKDALGRAVRAEQQVNPDYKGKCKDIIKQGKDGATEIVKRAELENLAKTLAKAKNTNTEKELSRLIKEKAFVTGVPYAFSLLFMGLTLSAITRLFTQYRYNKENKTKDNSSLQTGFEIKNHLPQVFSAFR